MKYDLRDSQPEEDSGPSGMDMLALQKVVVASTVGARRKHEFSIHAGKNENAGYAFARRLEKHGIIDSDGKLHWGNYARFVEMKRNGGLLEHDMREGLISALYKTDQEVTVGEDETFNVEAVSEADHSRVSLAELLGNTQFAELWYLGSKLEAKARERQAREQAKDAVMLETAKTGMRKDLANIYEGSDWLYLNRLDGLEPAEYIQAAGWVLDNHEQLTAYDKEDIASHLDHYGKFTSAGQFIGAMNSFLEPVAAEVAVTVQYDDGKVLDADAPQPFEDDLTPQIVAFTGSDGEDDERDFLESNGVVTGELFGDDEPTPSAGDYLWESHIGNGEPDPEADKWNIDDIEDPDFGKDEWNEILDELERSKVREVVGTTD